jgi:pimeloyl-ACP methyl ester carboxylesterase
MRTNVMGSRQTISIEGFSLRFWECGTGEQLLFLHGAALPAASCGELVEIFSRRYRVIVPELPGFGASDFPGRDWSYEQYADLMQELAARRGYDIREMVGYSFGGGIALHLAQRLPGLRRLTLLSPAGAAVSYRYGGLLARTLAEGWNGLREALRSRRLAAFARIVADFLFLGARNIYREHRILRVLLRCLRAGPPRAAPDLPVMLVTADRDIFFPRALLESLDRVGEKRQVPGIHLWVLLHPPQAERALFDGMGLPAGTAGAACCRKKPGAYSRPRAHESPVR